jgi:beta-phosphoglucomutase
MIKGVIFDMDGTLSDSETLSWAIWAELMAESGIEFSRSTYSQFVGGINISVAEWLKANHALEFSIEELEEHKMARQKRAYSDGLLRPMPHAIETLSFFKTRFPLGLATSTEKDDTLHKLRVLGFLDVFRAILCREDVEHRKPHPEIYLKASARLGLRPQECLVFEDTLIGVKAAKAAGCLTIAIPNSFTQHLDFSCADRVFPNLKTATCWVAKDIFKIPL